MRTVISVVILKIPLFTLIRNIFRLLANGGSDMNRGAAEINFHLTKRKNKRAKTGFAKCSAPAATWSPCAASPRDGFSRVPRNVVNHPRGYTFHN